MKRKNQAQSDNLLPTQAAYSEKAIRDLSTVEFMIRLYCRKKHLSKDGLCEECQELYEYVEQRRKHCPFGDNKTFCSNCKIQCYKPSMKEKIRAVMKYSGPRLLFYNPKLVLAHVRETVKLKRASKKSERKKAEK